MITYIGKKIGMTRGFTESGEAFPISVIAIETNKILSIKPVNEEVEVTVAAQPIEGRKNKKYRVTREFSVAKDEIGDLKEGEELPIEMLSSFTCAHIEGVSKGKGFAGVIKRHGFARGPETHGSDHHRHPGSIGGMYPQRVIAGKKMPGQMGATKATVKNLTIIGVDKERKALLVKGSVPGPNKGNLLVRVFNK